MKPTQYPKHLTPEGRLVLAIGRVEGARAERLRIRRALVPVVKYCRGENLHAPLVNGGHVQLATRIEAATRAPEAKRKGTK